jgi:tetratricopeptide (TPR) repeat protein
MTENAVSDLDRQKRRQAVQIALFLGVVAVGTGTAFHYIRDDAVSYRRGMTALAEREFSTAAVHLENAWTRGYRRPNLQLDLARALWAAGQPQSALLHYSEAVAGRATIEGELLDTVIGIYQSQGQPEKGLELFNRLGPPEKLPVESLARLGDLQQQTGRYEEAAATYRLALKRAPKEAELQLRLGVILSWLGRPQEAAEALRIVLSVDPGHRQAQRYLGRVLMWDGRFAEAVGHLREGLVQ